VEKVGDMIGEDKQQAIPLEPALIEAPAEIREKNQITIPKAIVDVTGLQPGDQVVFAVDKRDPNLISVHRLPDSYAGVLAGVYGAQEEAAAYLRGEQEAWNE
jgi:AbrB family looped-hinge helix DNA binding protein